MKIPHKELENVRKDPLKYKGATFKKDHGFSVYPTASIFRCALMEYHRSFSVQKAVSHFERIFDANRKATKANDRTKTEYIGHLFAYDSSYKKQGVSTIKPFPRIAIPIGGDIFISGEIIRIDIVNTGGYSACILTKNITDWKRELRMPLLQSYISSELKCSYSDVSVGIFSLESNTHTFYKFSPMQIRKAFEEANRIAAKLVE